MKNKNKRVMSIAGSDPLSGAGVQADLKALTNLGLHGLTVITCITIQNIDGVKKIYKIPIDLIEEQIDALYENIPPHSVKTGMLYDKEIINCVSKKM